MRMDDNKIEYRQLMFSVVCFLQCVSIHMSVLLNNAAQSSWIVVVMSTITGIIGCLIISGLCEVYGRQNLYEILKSGMGKILGIIVSALYLCFFSWKFCDTLFEFASFTRIAILPKTPGWIIELLIILVCAMAAKKGAAVFSGMSFIFAISVLLFTVLSVFLLIPNFDLSNFLPIFPDETGVLAKGFYVSSAEPFGDIIAFTMLIPFVKGNGKNKKLTKALVFGVIIGAVTLLLGILRDIATLGVFSKFFTFPSFECVRLIDIGEVFSRVELFYAILYTFLTFFKCTVLLFAISQLLKSITNKKNNDFIIIISTVLFFAIALGNKRVFNSIYMDLKYNVIISWIFAYGIPLLLLTAGAIKNKMKALNKNK